MNMNYLAAASRCTSLVIVLSFMALGAGPANAEQKIYWSTPTKFPPQIQKSNVDGSNVETVIEQSMTTGRVIDMELDAANGKIYWADNTRQAIMRANRDGSNVETLISDLTRVDGIALDLINGNGSIYWTDINTPASRGSIERSNLDGTGRVVVLDGLLAPQKLAIDGAGGKIYFSGPNTLSRVNLDGTGAIKVLAHSGADSISLDLANGHVYFAGSGVLRVDLDLENLVGVPIMGSVRGLKVDGVGGKFYWTGNTPSGWGVRRMNFDGTGSEILYDFGLHHSVACGYLLQIVEGLALDLAGGELLFGATLVTGHEFTPYSYGSINQVNLEGTGLESLLPYPDLVLCNPRGIAVDTGAGKIYWAEPHQGIGRANLDGTGFEMVHVNNSTRETDTAAHDIAVDPRDGKIYWSEFNVMGQSTHLHRANGDGSNVEAFGPFHDNPFAFGISLDLLNDKIYWADAVRQLPDRSVGVIYRMNLDGTGLESIDPLKNTRPVAVAVDPSAGKIYYGNDRLARIWGADLDGSNIELLAAPAASVLMYDLAIDASAGKLYWSTSAGIGSLDLTSLGLETIHDAATVGQHARIALVDGSPADGDGDGVPDDQDICPGGDDNVNSDGDLAPDFCDACPLDPDNDADGDGVCGDIDVCPLINDNQSDTDGDLLGDACDVCPLDSDNDVDGDGVCGDIDNCPIVDNANQADTDNDLVGNACDFDDDNDGICDIGPAIDGVCSAGPDNCPLDVNTDQADFDGDGDGDVCDSDVDNDGVTGGADACPMTISGEVINADGCSINDLSPCANDWKNHGAYVRNVAHASEDFVAAGLITEAEKDAIVSIAGSSSCGAKK